MKLSRPAVGKFTSVAERAQRFGLPIQPRAEASEIVGGSGAGRAPKLS
jgi:hypothetical protein